MADDNVVYLVTDNEDLIRDPLEDDNNLKEDVAALFGTNVASINLNAADNDAGGDAGSRMPVGSNSTDARSLSSYKRSRCDVWDDLDELFETVNGLPADLTELADLPGASYRTNTNPEWRI